MIPLQPPPINVELLNLRAVVVAWIASDGTVLNANAGFQSLVLSNSTESGILPNAFDCVVQPNFREILQRAEKTNAIAYQGHLSIGPPGQIISGVTGRIENHGGIFYLLAEHDIADLENHRRSVTDLNESLADTQRALARSIRSLEAVNVELARSNTDLEQFAYAASHDLVEPLRSVTSSVQLLQKRYSGQLDARADTFIAHAVSGATRMQTLIQDLLAFSRIGSKQGPTNEVAMEHALSEAMRSLETAIAQSNAQMTHDLLPTVNGHGTQITQLLQNLLANAIKFRGDKPAVVHVGARQEGAQWVFSVADQGIGIEPQYFERVFELFKRLHTREEYAGTGIGLALCKKIVERHRGRIWVASEPGQGTTFYFTLSV